MGIALLTQIMHEPAVGSVLLRATSCIVRRRVYLTPKL
jgi:hypothetical protein